jgi:hypothetical protein
LGLLNPAVRTMRQLWPASDLERLQREVCERSVSLGSFSKVHGCLIQPSWICASTGFAAAPENRR